MVQQFAKLIYFIIPCSHTDVIMFCGPSSDHFCKVSVQMDQRFLGGGDKWENGVWTINYELLYAINLKYNQSLLERYNYNRDSEICTLRVQSI